MNTPSGATDTITWTSLTGGLVGSVIAAVAAFMAAWITMRLTRRRDQEREEGRLREQDAERRKEVVAEVIGTFRALEVEVRLAPLLAGRSSGRMLQAAVLFYLSQRKQHPAVATWVLGQQRIFDAKMKAWRRVCWIPRAGRRRLNDVTLYLGELVGLLVLWAVNDVGDSAFDEPTRTPNQIAAAEGALRALP